MLLPYKEAIWNFIVLIKPSFVLKFFFKTLILLKYLNEDIQFIYLDGAWTLKGKIHQCLSFEIIMC